MEYLCPLCLERLKPKEQLIRFCRLHPDLTKCIDVDDNLLTNIYCPGGHLSQNCNLNPVDYAPLLAHQKCNQRNPFWGDDRFDIPATVYYKVHSAQGRDQPLDHWLVQALRDIPESFRENEAMWFPQALFRIFNGNKERKTSDWLASTVLLFGGQAAGKSVLATMALRPQTWSAELADKRIRQPRGYVYVSPKETGQEKEADFIDSLAALERRDGKLILETGINDRNIRALFFTEAPAEDNAVQPDDSSSLKIFNFNNVKETMGKIWGAGQQAAAELSVEVPHTVEAVVFYDIKGELATKGDPRVLKMINALKKVALVINAEDLSQFGNALAASKELQDSSGSPVGRRNSIEVLVDRGLPHLTAIKKPISLVVTHLDRIRKLQGDKIPKGWPEYWKKYPDDVKNYSTSSSKAERDILRTVLNRDVWYERVLWAFLEQNETLSGPKMSIRLNVTQSV
jgi:hypothetical protein